MSENSSQEISTENIRVPRPWMKQVLIVAGFYNLTWGLWASVAPQSMLTLLGVDPLPRYPEFWQCIGMIVGVYGIGYLIAANRPFVHWPIVLVGLLGKIFGPLGFAMSVWQGRLPASMGWTLITNDLIWWIPFAMILWGAALSHQCDNRRSIRTTCRTVIDPMSRLLSQRGSSLMSLSRQSPVLVVFLRHSGCTFCREALGDLARDRKLIEDQGTRLAIVHMGQEEPQTLLKKYGLEDVHCFRDPDCVLYESFGLKLGGPMALLGPKVWWRGAKAYFSGHGVGALDGNVFRLPGVFLIQDGHILRSYRHTSAADRPDYIGLARCPEDTRSHENVPEDDRSCSTALSL